MISRWQKYNPEDSYLESENLMFFEDEDEWLDEDEEFLSSRPTLPRNSHFHEGPIN